MITLCLCAFRFLRASHHRTCFLLGHSTAAKYSFPYNLLTSCVRWLAVATIGTTAHPNSVAQYLCKHHSPIILPSSSASLISPIFFYFAAQIERSSLCARWTEVTWCDGETFMKKINGRDMSMWHISASNTHSHTPRVTWLHYYNKSVYTHSSVEALQCFIILSWTRW